MIGSKHPDPNIQKNIEETMGYIINGGKPPRALGANNNPTHNKWGVEFRNENGDLPTQLSNGEKIQYKEYRVRPLDKNPNNNVHRIVVGSDGRYYYTNTHYGDVTRNGGGGIPFYEAGKLPKDTVEKIFKKDKK